MAINYESRYGRAVGLSLALVEWELSEGVIPDPPENWRGDLLAAREALREMHRQFEAQRDPRVTDADRRQPAKPPRKRRSYRTRRPEMFDLLRQKPDLTLDELQRLGECNRATAVAIRREFDEETGYQRQPWRRPIRQKIKELLQQPGFSNLSNREIADRLNCSPKVVGQARREARRELNHKNSGD